MRILFMLGSLDSGGAQRVAVNLCNTFVEKGNEVRILVTKLNGNIYKVNKDINIIELDNDRSKKSIFRERHIIKNIAKEIESYKPNVVISFLPEPTARILFLKKFSRKMRDVPVIISVRNDPKKIYSGIKAKLSMKLLYSVASGYVFQTNEAKAFFDKKIQNKSKIILNPANKTTLTLSNKLLKETFPSLLT